MTTSTQSKTKKIEKPIPRLPDVEPAYDWDEIEAYVRKETGKDPRDWGDKYKRGIDEKAPYQDFWHYITHNHEIHNPCNFYLELDPQYLNEEWKWVEEIFDFLNKEFPEANGEMYCYVSW